MEELCDQEKRGKTKQSIIKQPKKATKKERPNRGRYDEQKWSSLFVS